MKRAVLLCFLASTLTAHAGETVPSTGIVADPCVVLPAMPAVVADYLERATIARAAGRPLPPRSPEGMSVYAKWQQDLLLADFAGLCRYRADNAALPAPTDRRVVFMGDSITEGWIGAQPDFFSGGRIDRGISGQTTAQMLARFRQDVINLRPRAVHIMAGTNDIAGNLGPTTLDRIEANILTMIELAQAHGISVVLGAVPPARHFNWRPGIEPAQSIVELNSRLRSIAAARGLVFADYHAALDDGSHGLSPRHSEDGVHPTADGYAAMRPVAEAAIRQVLTANKAPARTSALPASPLPHMLRSNQIVNGNAG